MTSMSACFTLLTVLLNVHLAFLHTQAVVIKTLKVPYGVDAQEEHICTALPLNSEMEEYVVSFDPKADPFRVLHLSLQVCDGIPGESLLWSCGDNKPGCLGNIRPIYVWGMNSTTWRLPPETGIPVGGSSAGRFIVLQAHVHKPKHTGYATRPDYAAIKLSLSRRRPQFEMGLLILGNTGFIPPDNHRFVSESVCSWNTDQSAYILGYRLHTHSLGRWVEGFVHADNQWKLIGQGKPLAPENVQRSWSEVFLEKGDILISRCYFDNNRASPVQFGSGYNDEMCNFHLLYVFPYGASPSLRFRTCAEDAQSFTLKSVMKVVPPVKDTIPSEDENMVY